MSLCFYLVKITVSCSGKSIKKSFAYIYRFIWTFASFLKKRIPRRLIKSWLRIRYWAQSRAWRRIPISINLLVTCINARWVNRLWEHHVKRLHIDAIINYTGMLILQPDWHVRKKIKNLKSRKIILNFFTFFLRIQTPQSPLVRPYMYDHYKMDNFPWGTNAVVAVISYTGKWTRQ